MRCTNKYVPVLTLYVHMQMCTNIYKHTCTLQTGTYKNILALICHDVGTVCDCKSILT